MTSFGQHLRHLRKLRGLSQRQFVSRLQDRGLHVSRGLLSRIEQDRSEPVLSEPLVSGIAAVLETDPEALLILARDRPADASRDPQTISTAPSANAKPRSFLEDMRQVGSVGKWVVLLLLTNSLSAIALNVIDPGQLGERDIAKIIEFFKVTAPLTASVAIIGIGLLRGWLPDEGLLGVLVVAVVLFGATWLGNILGSSATTVQPLQVLKENPNPFNFVLAMVVGFFSTYGWWTFLQSVAVGGFVSWAGAKMMWPHAERLYQGNR